MRFRVLKNGQAISEHSSLGEAWDAAWEAARELDEPTMTPKNAQESVRLIVGDTNIIVEKCYA